MPDIPTQTDYQKHFDNFSEPDLEVFLLSGHHDTAMKSAAAKALYTKKRERENFLHAELLAEIKKPHWSVTPSFGLLVVSVLLTAAALVVAYIGLPQAKSPAAATDSSTQTIPHTSDTPASSPQAQPKGSPRRAQ